MTSTTTSNGNAEFVDDNSLRVQLSDGTNAILDTSSGKTSAVAPTQVFWCIGGHTFKVNENKTFNKTEKRLEDNGRRPVGPAQGVA
jgi:hypothetical protein